MTRWKQPPVRECQFCHGRFVAEKGSFRYCPEHRSRRFYDRVCRGESGIRRIAVNIDLTLLAAIDNYCARYEQQKGTKLPRETLMVFAIKKFMKA
jgi:hypothetical protein